MSRIKYEPKSVRELLTEMKDVSDTMIDLAYAALQFQDKEIAEQVRKLEAKMDELMYEIRILATMSVRSTDDAEKMTGVLQIANAAETISNATEEMVDLVLRDIEIHPVIQTALMETEERTDVVEVGGGSSLDGKILSNLRLPSRIGVWILALKRRGSWLVPPAKNTRIRGKDLLVAKGPEEGIEILHEMAGVPWKPRSLGRRLRKLRDALARMRDLSSSMVDMAYSAVLFRSREVAEEVRELEGVFDGLNYELSLAVLRAAKREKDVGKLNSVLQFVKYMEKISNSADLIADVILHGVELHPVFARALEEAEEQIGKVRVSKRSPLAGHTLGKLNLEVRTGVDVFTVKRGKKYIFNPADRVTILPGDYLIVRGPELGIENLKKIAAGRGKLPPLEE